MKGDKVGCMALKIDRMVNNRVKYREDITQWREDMNFIFEWQNSIFRMSIASEALAVV